MNPIFLTLIAILTTTLILVLVMRQQGEGREMPLARRRLLLATFLLGVAALVATVVALG